MNFRLVIFITVLFYVASAGGAAQTCSPFPDAQNTFSPTRLTKSFCFTVKIPDGLAIQLSVEQPVDLAFVVSGAGGSFEVDGFEFGLETLTLGHRYEARVQLLSRDSEPLPRQILVSRKLLPLQKESDFHSAELLATETKRLPIEAQISESLNQWRDLEDVSAVTRTYLKRGDFYLSKQDYQSARAGYESALRLCEELQDLRCHAEAANNSGLASQNLGDFESAKSRLELAVRIWTSLKKPKFKGIALSNLGLVCLKTNQFQQASTYLSQAADVLSQAAPGNYSIALNNFGLYYQELAEYRLAAYYFEKALRIPGSLGNKNHFSLSAEINLGRNFALNGQPIRGIQILRRAENRARQMGDRQALADALSNLAQVWLAQKAAFKATPLLEEALSLHNILRDQKAASKDGHCLGLAAALEGRTGDAKAWFADVISVRSQLELRAEASDSYYQFALLELKDGNLPSAKSLVEKALSLTESVRGDVPGAAQRALFSASNRRLFDLLIQIELAQQSPDAVRAALLTAERGQGRALLDVLAESSLLPSPPPDLLEKRETLDRRIGVISRALLGAPYESVRALRNRAELLISQREAVEAQIAATQPERRFGRPLESVELLQKSLLPKETALLEYHLGNPESYLWLVTSSSIEIFPLPSKTKLDRESGQLLALFSRVTDRKQSLELQRKFESATRSLSRDILGALQGRTLPETLILVCDGTLHRVPFEALSLSQSGPAIGLSHAFVRVPSAGYLAAGREIPAISSFPLKFAGVADPVFSRSDSRLPAALSGPASSQDLARLPFTAEFEVVKHLLPASKMTVLRGFQASRAELMKLQLTDYAVLHMSTHAIVDDTVPELSRVALSLFNRAGQAQDGYLRPPQLASLRLSGAIVVLSACQTALGREVMGEGLAGLSATLFQAGASQLVLTLTLVDAESSAEFFSEVYRGLFQKNAMPMERALLKARKFLAASQRWSDPYYWAPFVLVGRPSGRV